jgi:hypothetical protein
VLLRAEVHYEAKDMANALLIAYESLNEAERFNLDPLHAYAVVLISRIRLALLDNPREIEEKLLEVYPLINSNNGDADLVARGVFARALIIYSRRDLTDTDRKFILELMDKAIMHAGIMEDLALLGEMELLKARLHNDLNQIAERDECAKVCEECEEATRENPSKPKNAMAEWAIYEERRLNPGI